MSAALPRPRELSLRTYGNFFFKEVKPYKRSSSLFEAFKEEVKRSGQTFHMSARSCRAERCRLRARTKRAGGVGVERPTAAGDHGARAPDERATSEIAQMPDNCANGKVFAE